MKPSGLQPVHKIIVFVAVILAATILWFATASPMTPSEHFATMAKKALVTDNYHAYQMRYDNQGWHVLIFNTYGMSWITTPNKPWPKHQIVRHASIKDGVVQRALLGLGVWHKNTCPRWQPMRGLNTLDAQQLLNKILDGSLPTHNSYDLYKGSIETFWSDVIAPIIDRPEYNKKPDKTEPKVEMSI